MIMKQKTKPILITIAMALIIMMKTRSGNRNKTQVD